MSSHLILLCYSKLFITLIEKKKNVLNVITEPTVQGELTDGHVLPWSADILTRLPESEVTPFRLKLRGIAPVRHRDPNNL